MKTPFHTPRWHHSSSRRSLNPLQRVYAKSCSPPTLQRWIQWLAGKGVKMLDLKVWSGSVWFSIDDLLKVFREKLWPDFLGRVSTIEGKTWFFLPIFWGGCLLFGLTTYVCSFQASITVEGTEFVIDSARAKEVSYDPYLKVGTLTTSWISKAPRGCDGDIFSMILIFFGGEVFGVVYGWHLSKNKLIQVTNVFLECIVDYKAWTKHQKRIWRIQLRSHWKTAGCEFAYSRLVQWTVRERHRPSSELVVQASFLAGDVTPKL